MELERKITFDRPAFDYILHPTEDRGKEYGRGSVEMRFILKGPECAITWGIITGWNLPETNEALKAEEFQDVMKPMGTAVCIHSATNNRDYYGDPIPCDVLDQGECYGDCGYIAGSEFFDVLVREGEEALWAKMQEWYDDYSQPEKKIEEVKNAD